jgi:Cu-Zn family superoxide dismutase
LADAAGVAKVDMVDTMTALSGPNSIIGRAMVVHANEDDLGRQDNEGSRTTGNSGPRIACGIIFIAP